jgi:hypothetical protein
MPVSGARCVLGPDILLGVKPSGSAADGTFVPDADSILLLLTLAVIAAGALSVLYTTASAIRNATAAHDLKVRVAGLRVEYLRRLRRAERDAEIVVDAVEDQPAEPARAAA